MFGNFYTGKRALVTGHTGFKGGWLSLWLRQLGAAVHGFSLPAPTQPSFHELLKDGVFATETIADIRDAQAVDAAVRQVAPDIIFHLAAQPLVRRSYSEPIETFTTNALGTAILLEAVRRAGRPCVVIVVTSDKCYENRGWEFSYRENDPLGGRDVYSMSKGAAELVVRSWRQSFFQPDSQLGPIASARAGNVIGGGDYAEDRIVPDCVRALLAKQPVAVRNSAATRPWQHVLDCLSGYLWLGARLAQAGKHSPLADAFNFGPGAFANRTVAVLVEEILRHWPGEWRDASDPAAPAEASRLNLATDKATYWLGWFSTWDFPEAVEQTLAWYYQRHLANNPAMLEFSRAQIELFGRAAQAKGLAWANTAPL